MPSAICEIRDFFKFIYLFHSFIFLLFLIALGKVVFYNGASYLFQWDELSLV